MKLPIVFVLYDSITNSIFDSQIAQPLLQQQTDLGTVITIVSFEKRMVTQELNTIAQQYPTLNFIFLKNRIFVHKALLSTLANKLHALLSKLASYKLIARGPIAGYLCMQALQKTNCFEFIIQARGILAEEYRFTHARTNNNYLRALHYFRSYQFEKVEKSVYSKQTAYVVPTTIEAVSPALKEYLIQHYQADPNMIHIAQIDIPLPFSTDVIQKWRKITRSELGVSEKTSIYCYNGSLKPWQCPQETISFFKEQLIKNTDVYLLVLTQDKHDFEKIIQNYLIDPTKYKVITVPHKEIYRYLAGCDSGIIFREKNSINWTSRPTKILEYQAVGLPIIHNNTIAMLQNSSSIQEVQ